MKTPIILISYNRHHYLNRILSYYQEHNYDQFLIIADGSEKEWLGSAGFKGEYLHFPNLSYRERLKKALEISDSDLAVLCADDDFLVPSGLEECIKFMRDNSEYSCVHGRYGRFVINDGKINYTQKHAELNSIVDNEPLTRIKKVFIPKFFQHFYAVHRRKNLERAINFPEMNDFEWNFNFEMLLTFSSLIDGKAKKLNHIYYFREMLNSKVGVSKDPLSVRKIERALRTCKLYLKILVEDLTNKDDFSDTIDSAIAYLLKYHLYHYNKNISKKSNIIINKNNIKLYLSKLKQPGAWVKILKPYSLISGVFFSKNNIKNSFPLNDEHTKKEFEIIDETLKNWIDYMKINVPEN